MNKAEFNARCFALQAEINRTLSAHVDALSPSDGALVATTVMFGLMSTVAANVVDDDAGAVTMIRDAPWAELIAHSRKAVMAARAERTPRHPPADPEPH